MRVYYLIFRAMSRNYRGYDFRKDDTVAVYFHDSISTGDSGFRTLHKIELGKIH